MIRCSARSAWGSPMPIASAWSGATAPVTSVIALGAGRLQEYAGGYSDMLRQRAPLRRPAPSSTPRGPAASRAKSARPPLRAPSSTQREPERLIDRIGAMEEIRRPRRAADPDLFRRGPEAFAACTDRPARAQPNWKEPRSAGWVSASTGSRSFESYVFELRRRQSRQDRDQARLRRTPSYLMGAGHVATLNQWSYQRTPVRARGPAIAARVKRRRAWKCWKLSRAHVGVVSHHGDRPVVCSAVGALAARHGAGGSAEPAERDLASGPGSRARMAGPRDVVGKGHARRGQSRPSAR